MDLGLGQLTDDQLLELVHEVCRELALRDPYVRAMAQHTITTESDRLVLRRAMLKEAVTAVAGSYVEQIRGESFREVQEGVRTGRIRLLTPAQEARILVDSTLEAKIKLIDETVTAIQHERLQRVFAGAGRADTGWQSGAVNGEQHFDAAGPDECLPALAGKGCKADGDRGICRYSGREAGRHRESA